MFMSFIGLASVVHGIGSAAYNQIHLIIMSLQVFVDGVIIMLYVDMTARPKQQEIVQISCLQFLIRPNLLFRRSEMHMSMFCVQLKQGIRQV